ncbi:hypothetical protein RR48_13575 [Papilio machaon]|uniref:Uncharacterized protein n=1 Tax=Papilio machaon TaxID=76193 RepID=A0A194RAH6_PAPMA|nr:hypothetical protein RR48_13575 [Papilio machaon]
MAVQCATQAAAPLATALRTLATQPHSNALFIPLTRPSIKLRYERTIVLERKRPKHLTCPSRLFTARLKNDSLRVNLRK